MTLEADYAVRIVDVIARNRDRMSAKMIAEQAHVTPKVSLKILRKLVSRGVVRSYRGSLGGYELALPMNKISLYDVLTTIDRQIVLNRCVLKKTTCAHVPEKNCPYRVIYAQLSEHVQNQLSTVSFADVINASEPASTHTKKEGEHPR